MGSRADAKNGPTVPNVKIETKAAIVKRENQLPPLKFVQAQSHQIDLEVPSADRKRHSLVKRSTMKIVTETSQTQSKKSNAFLISKSF